MLHKVSIQFIMYKNCENVTMLCYEANPKFNHANSFKLDKFIARDRVNHKNSLE